MRRSMGRSMTLGVFSTTIFLFDCSLRSLSGLAGEDDDVSSNGVAAEAGTEAGAPSNQPGDASAEGTLPPQRCPSSEPGVSRAFQRLGDAGRSWIRRNLLWDFRVCEPRLPQCANVPDIGQSAFRQRHSVGESDHAGIRNEPPCGHHDRHHRTRAPWSALELASSLAPRRSPPYGGTNESAPKGRRKSGPQASAHSL